MRKIILSLFFLSLTLSTHAGFVIPPNSQTYYWECSIAIDANTNMPQFNAGDGITSITVWSIGGTPVKIEESNRTLELTFKEENNMWKVFNSQYQNLKVWVNNKYVLIVSYLNGTPYYMVRYNPQKGVISGTQDGLNPNSGGFSNGGNYNNGGSSGGSRSDGYTCPTCHGSGRCTMCAGRGEWRDSNGRLHDCSMCHGGGACYGCHGKGRIR